MSNLTIMHSGTKNMTNSSTDVPYKWTFLLDIAKFITPLSGAIAGFILIIAIVSKKLWKRQSYLFLLNISTASLLLCVPYNATVKLLNVHFQRHTSMRIVTCMEGICSCASNLFEALIAVDRCCAVTGRMSLDHGIRKKMAQVAAVSVWIIAAVLNVFLAWYGNQNEKESVTKYSRCQEYEEIQDNKNVGFLVDMLISYFFPLIIITYSNWMIRQTVSHREIPTSTANADVLKMQHQTALRKVDARVIVEIICFTLCSFPLNSFPCLFMAFHRCSGGEDMSNSDIPIELARILNSLGGFLRSISHGFLDRKLRRQMKQLLCSMQAEDSFTFIPKFMSNSAANGDTTQKASAVLFVNMGGMKARSPLLGRERRAVPSFV